MKRGYRNCIKKVAGIIGAVMMASCCGSVVCDYDVPVSITQVSAQQQYNITAEQAKSVMFNAVYYANLYPDLKKAFGYDSGKLYEHYYWYGIQEGRSASPIFDPKYYLENNADLKRAFGVDYKAAYQHWIDYGCSEGRASSKYSSGKYYKEKYRDLQNAYFNGGSNANNYYKLALHYLNYGISEKRQANVHGLVPGGMVRQEVEQYVVSTNGATLALRSGPDTNYGIKARMPRGSVVEVYSISNGWANLSYNGMSGYASSSYLIKKGDNEQENDWDRYVGRMPGNLNLNSSYYQARSSNNPFAKSYRDSNGRYHSTNCTWYAYGRFYEVNGQKLGVTGMPYRWSGQARNNGFSIGTSPRSKSVAVAEKHVMFVENVSNGYVYFTEANYGDDFVVKKMSIAEFTNKRKIQSYIYAK